MKRLSHWICVCAACGILPMAGNAAGTYYTGNYQSPQARYNNSQTYAQRARTTGTSGYAQNGTYSSYASTRPVATANRVTRTGVATNNVTNKNVQTTTQTAKKDTGFWIDAGITHEMAQWQFEMKQATSILQYDNIGWNVFDARAGYVFDMGNVRGQIDAGFKYGMQSGESKMVDDDVTNGGYLQTTWVDPDGDYLGDQIGHALSVGASKDGNMYGFNIGFGLSDVFKWGNLHFTPSVGYRYLKYKLETTNNNGLSVDTSACFQIDGETQCDPMIIFEWIDSNGNVTEQGVIFRDDVQEPIKIPVNQSGTYPNIINTAGTYYYKQPGVSHSYEVEWAGPYLAMDMDYMINAYNAVNGRVELGVPGYTATGNQPYRFDWAHPKSVEDKAGMFGAFHFGLGANWTTAISDNVAFSLGLTYDYYSVSDADATTYLNADYFTTLYNERLDIWQDAGYTESDMLDPETGDAIAINIKDTEAECPGWVCKTDSEIESFYKSMGIRVGINAKF